MTRDYHGIKHHDYNDTRLVTVWTHDSGHMMFTSQLTVLKDYTPHVR